MEWTMQMLEVYECVKVDRLNNGNLRSVDYKTVAEELNAKIGSKKVDTTAYKNKVENMKRRYRAELVKQSQSGGVPSRWEFFKRFNSISFAQPQYSGVIGGMDGGTVSNGMPRHIVEPFLARSPAPESPVSRPIQPPEVIDLDRDEPTLGTPIPALASLPRNVTEGLPTPTAPVAPVAPAAPTTSAATVEPGPAPPVSPRSEMCARNGVRGQTNKRRKSSVGESSKVIFSLNSMMTQVTEAWTSIEEKKLLLLEKFLLRRSL